MNTGVVHEPGCPVPPSPSPQRGERLVDRLNISEALSADEHDGILANRGAYVDGWGRRSLRFVDWGGGNPTPLNTDAERAEMAGGSARQRARLAAAEVEVFAHYGVEATSEQLDVEDPALTTRVVRCGRGPATVLLHGGGMTATVWAPLLPHLPGRTLYLIDLPGCGLADPFDYAEVDLAAHQRAFVGSALDALGLARAALVGSSLGGMFALRFTLEQPARVTALSCVSAPAFALPGARVPFPMSLSSSRRLGRLMTALAPAPSPRVMRRMLVMIGGKQGVRDVPESLFDALGAALALAGPTNASLGPEAFRWSTPHAHLAVTDEELAGCQVPVQFIWGDQDKVQSPAAGARAAELLPNGRIQVLPGGHGIWFDAPARCGHLLTEFLRDAEDSGA